jgi:hypothetical protein
MSRAVKSIVSLVFIIMVLYAGPAWGCALASPGGSPVELRLSAASEFLYASRPGGPAEDPVLLTAHIYKDGQPVRKAGIPVDFTISDSRFATLDNKRVYTDDWGTATTRIRSLDSGIPLPSHPFLVTVMASAEGKSSLVTLPLTGYKSLSGIVKDKDGRPVNAAKVVLLYKQTNNPINVAGSTTTTDADGKYYLEKVPTDVGDVIVYVKKGGLETYSPADISSAYT